MPNYGNEIQSDKYEIKSSCPDFRDTMRAAVML